MKQRKFQPGFRFSILDGVILLAGGIGTALLWKTQWWLGLIIAFVVLHFFLFCNVFRIARRPELVWAVLFLIMAGSAIVFEIPAWWVVFAAGLVASSILIFRETRQPYYHGVGWRRWNPNLEEWWRRRWADPER